MTVVPVPRDWTPEQAEACLELLHALYDAIWEDYEDVLVTRYLAKGMGVDQPPDPPEPPDYLDPLSYEHADDDIPF